MQYKQIYTKECTIGRTDRLKYFVICNSEEPEPLYEIQIEKWRDHNLIERERTGGLTRNRAKAITFLNRLCRNLVTPFSLLEVTDDCFYDTI